MSAIRTNSKGHVYILMNASIQGMLKIGKTTKTPEERAKDLSKDTGVATPFWVAYSEEVPDCTTAETILHERLNKFRVNKKREFFHLSLKHAIKEIAEIKAEMERKAKLEKEAKNQATQSEESVTETPNYSLDSETIKSLDDARIAKKRVLAVAQRTFKGLKNTYLNPKIPDHKLKNVVTRYGTFIQPEEDVLLIYDGTWMGGAENGFILTTSGIGCAYNDGPPSFFKYEDLNLRELCIGTSSKQFYIQGDTMAEVWSSEKVSVLLALKSAIAEIQSQLKS